MSIQRCSCSSVVSPPNRLPVAARIAVRIHRFLYRSTGGLLGHRLPGRLRCLLLTTVGAKSGLRRQTPLVYGRDGEALVLIASQGGLPTHPPWYHNLRAHPEVTVQVGRSTQLMIARDATDDERPRLWSMMVRTYGGYENYQRNTTRQIPVVVLDPVG